MDPDDGDLIDKLISPLGTFGTGNQQKVIVQRNSPALFPSGTPLTINATSSLLVPNSVPLPVVPQQLAFGASQLDTGLPLAACSSGIDPTSVIVLNKDTTLQSGAIPFNVVTAEPQQQFIHGGNVQKVVVASASGPSASTSHTGVQIVAAGTMKTLQQKVSSRYSPHSHT